MTPCIVLMSVYIFFEVLKDIVKKTFHEKTFHPIPKFIKKKLVKHTEVVGPITDKAQGLFIEIKRATKLRFQQAQGDAIVNLVLSITYGPLEE